MSPSTAPLAPGDQPAVPRSRWSLLDFRLDLKKRLVLIISGIIFLILTGQTLITLSNEVAHLDLDIANRATILTQAISSSCVGVMRGDDPDRFDAIVHRVRREVDLVSLSIVDNLERIVGHSDPAEIGREHAGGQLNVFGRPRQQTSRGILLGGHTEYVASAPIVDGTTVLGFVVLEFRSSEAAERAAQRLRSVTAMGLFWLLVGGFIGTIYVRRITRPLARLTTAATAITRGELEGVEVEPATSDDEIGLLQRSFSHLVTSLRAERAENAGLVEQLGEMNLQLRQRVEEVTADLREASAYLQSILRCMEEGVITCDRDGHVVRANLGASRQLLGLAQPEPGTHIREVIPDGEPLAQAAREAIETGAHSQLRLERSSSQGPWDSWHPADAMVIGGVRTIRFRIHPLVDSEDVPLGAVVTVVDETEDRRLEARMRRHDRFVSLGSIAAGLAHELGNYMHSINGFSSVLLRGMPDGDQRKADLEAIHRDNAAAVKLLERFLQFARPGEGKYRHDSMHGLLRNSMDMCSFSLRKNHVELVEDLGEQDVQVRCDGHLLSQVFINLLLNAADAMGGDREQRVMRVSARAVDDEHVEIKFQDTGSGIEPEHLDRVFDPFFTTKESGGTGLGLSIAHQIIARHEGTISVESQMGKGTVFTILLPIEGPQEGTK